MTARMAAVFGCRLPTGRAAPTTEALRELAALMRPRPSPVELRKIGGEGDGAYLLPDDLAGIRACFSPGVDNRKTFEDALSDEFGIVCHMIDRSSSEERFRTPLRPGLQSFRPLWLYTKDGPESITLDTWVREFTPDPADDLMLQMDIEGAEYRTLLQVPDAVLARFRIIVLELHALHRAMEPGVFHAVLLPLLRRLNAGHLCVHAHPNNCCGHVVLGETGLDLPRVMELTFLRRDRVPEGAALIPPQLPHPLDVGRNVPHKPPLFLSEAWLDAPRGPASRIKLLQDRLDHATEVARQAQARRMQDVAALLALVREALAPPDAPPADSLVEVARGRPFRLTGAAPGVPPTGTVAPDAAGFCRTGVGPCQAITLDLGRPVAVHRVVARQVGERPPPLFVALHEAPERGDARPWPLLPEPAGASATLPGVTARHVTILSPLTAALCLADVAVLARPCAPGVADC